MNTLKYKGYIGSVSYSEPDKVFFGEIEGINDLVTYEGESVDELTASFHEAVEDYLIFCEEHHCKPGSDSLRAGGRTDSCRGSSSAAQSPVQG